MASISLVSFTAKNRHYLSNESGQLLSPSNRTTSKYRNIKVAADNITSS
jgi:hypothetical protein